MLSNIDSDSISGDMPPWMKELRLRRRTKQLHNNIESPQTAGPSSSSSVTIGGVTVQQPSSPSRCHTATSSSCAVNIDKDRVKCNNTNKMVQERSWIDHTDQLIEKIEGAGKGDDSDSSEELKYGPGIVSKLKNRYLSLTLRETAAKTRPSILNLRKAASLEHILDDYEVEDKSEKCEDGKTNRLFERHHSTGITKNVANRYSKNATLKSDMKRARSVEIISNLDHDALLTDDVKTKRESLHEEMLVIEGNDKTCNTTDKKVFQIEDNRNFSNSIGSRLNRPKKIQPVMNEKEKPPADKVKETKKLFERPEQRTKPPQPTGEVAAKVAGFKTIINLTKAINKKPPIKQKPHIDKIVKPDRPKVQIKRETSVEKRTTLGSPIPPLRSPIKEYKPEIKLNAAPTSLPTQTTIPDVSKLTPSPDEINGFLNSSLSETPDLIPHSSHRKTEQIENVLRAEEEHATVEQKNKINLEKSKEFDLSDSPCSSDSEGITKISTESQKKIGSVGNSVIYSFSSPVKIKDHLPRIELPKKTIKNENGIPEMPKDSPAHQQLSPIKQKPRPNNFIETKIPSNETGESIKLSPTKEKTPQKGIAQKEGSPKAKAPRSPTKSFENRVPVTEQLKVEIINDNTEPPKLTNKISNKQKLSEPVLLKKQPPSPVKEKVVAVSQKQSNNIDVATETKNNSIGKLSDKVIEKNLINAAKTVETSSKLNGSVHVNNKSENGVLKTNEVPALKKKKPPARQRQDQQNCLVFDFTGRKDVPDYVGNDGRIKPVAKIERPKPGEGGIIILPGATLDETLVDDDEEDWKRLLECPPSPCNITFTNDNILIDGRSSLKKLKKPKMTIRFIEAGPEVFEYPSETSLLDDNHVSALTNSSSVGHAVPSLSGSSLANYTPKSAFQGEEFQLGVKPSLPTPNPTETKQTDDISDEPVTLQDAPILFSAGTNSDILF